MPRQNNDENHTLGDILKSFVETNNLQQGLDKVNVQKAWEELMGNGVNNYTTEIKLERETLYVQLNSSVLREELSYGKDKIVKMLNEHLGKDLIKKIVLR